MKKLLSRKAALVLLLILSGLYLLVLFLHSFAFLLVRIPFPYMSPTLHKGDIVLLNRLAYVFSSPRPGDIVAMNKPRGKFKMLFHVVRVLAISGDDVEIKGKEILVNNLPLKEPYHPDRPSMQYQAKVPKDSFFALDDNGPPEEFDPEHSIFSISSVTGKLAFVIYPLSHMKKL